MFLLFPWCLGSQAVVSFVLEKEISIEPFSLVAEEDSGDLCVESGQETLQRITKLVNETLTNDKSYGVYTLTKEQVLQAIDSGKSEGGSSGKHRVLDPIDGTKGFLSGDQYAIALVLLDKGKVVLGVLACPNLSLASIGINNQDFSQSEVGLFFAKLSGGTYMQLLDGSSPIKFAQYAFNENFLGIDGMCCDNGFERTIWNYVSWALPFQKIKIKINKT
ncbi:hypothetical protein UlMin_015447 [Ulmus minor]